METLLGGMHRSISGFFDYSRRWGFIQWKLLSPTECSLRWNYLTLLHQKFFSSFWFGLILAKLWFFCWRLDFCLGDGMLLWLVRFRFDKNKCLLNSLTFSLHFLLKNFDFLLKLFSFGFKLYNLGVIELIPGKYFIIKLLFLLLFIGKNHILHELLPRQLHCVIESCDHSIS